MADTVPVFKNGGGKNAKIVRFPNSVPEALTSVVKGAGQMDRANC